MTLRTKQFLIGFLGFTFLASLLLVQGLEVVRRREEAGLAHARVAVPAASKSCVECHTKLSRGIVDHWTGSTHAQKGVGCVECHQADRDDADSFEHYGAMIAVIVTPRDCGRCHKTEYEEFTESHHAKGGNILASLDNLLAETVEGSREAFDPHSPTPGRTGAHAVVKVNGMSSADVGCKQCHGSKVAIETVDGSALTVDDFKPGPDGKPTVKDLKAKIKREKDRPVLTAATWPNTGIGRLNLDGSRGSCSACHSRHDFSPRRARQPENCAKCHLGPDHPQKEIYEESKHGVAFRDLMLKMNLDSKKWVLGEDYSQAPTCATCHMSANSRDRKVTHNPGKRISWTNRPPISLMLDTGKDGEVVKETDPEKRKALVTDPWQNKRNNMKQVCMHCHTENYVDSFYKQYDDFVINYNEKFAKPGKKIMDALREQKLITAQEFDESIEWTWFYLWHHEGRRARHGASMMAPDYAHWHGMYEVAERFYDVMVPEARKIADEAAEHGNKAGAEAIHKLVNDILSRPEHAWYESQKKAKPDAPAKAAEALKVDAEKAAAVKALVAPPPAEAKPAADGKTAEKPADKAAAATTEKKS